MQKRHPQRWPKKAIILTALLGFFIYILFSPSNPDGIWNSRHFIAYADGTFAKLKINKNKYWIGDEGLLFGELRKASTSSRSCDLYNNGNYYISIKSYGPILLIFDKSSDVRSWGYRDYKF